MQLVAIIVMSAIAGMGGGLWWGQRLWGPRWFDSSAGVDRRFRQKF